MTFRYEIAKKSTGIFSYTTRPVFGNSLTEAELLAKIEFAMPLNRAEVLKLFAFIRKEIVEAARSGRPSETLFDLFRMSLSCGGAMQRPNGNISKDELNPQIVFYPDGSVQREISAGLDVEWVGISEELLPVLEIVRNMSTKEVDTYTPGGVLRITGENLKVNFSENPSLGVYFVNNAGAEVPVTNYLDITQEMLTFFVPSTLSGAQDLKVKTAFGQNIREAFYHSTLVMDGDGLV